MEDGYCESFKGKLCDEPFNAEILWRRHYNTVCLHSSLGDRPLVPEAVVSAAFKPLLQMPALN